jgi:Undecaprenyl-phosphate glucose phosphotransferase
MTDLSSTHAGIGSPTEPKAEAPTGSVLAEMMAHMPTQASLSPVVVTGLARLSEFLLLILSAFIVYQIYLPELTEENVRSYIFMVGFASVGAVIAFGLLDAYTIQSFRTVMRTGMKLILGWGIVFLLVFAMLFFLKLEGLFSRVFFAGWFFGGLALLLAGRVGLSVLVRGLTRQGRLERRTAIVGGGENGETLLRALQRQGEGDLRICGVFDDRTDARSPDLVAGYPKLGTVDDLVSYSRKARIDLVIFTIPLIAESRVLQMMRKLSVLPVDIRLSAHTNKLKFRPRNYSYLGNVPVFDMADKPIADWDLVAKWLFDKVVGSLMLLLLSPIMLMVALAVKLDSKGPVFFKQKRYGFNNELIEVFKFRSMRTDMLDATASKLVTKGDPRVTRVGRFIRKTSLDELPQLFNVVFRGNLSLIGPRPHAVHAKAANQLYDSVVDGYFARHKVKPGITGWAQVNGWRGETDTEEKIQKRVQYDLEYIENWSVWFDAYILFMTPFALTKTENAY